MGLPAGVEYDPNAPFNETDIVKDISVVIDGEIKITKGDSISLELISYEKVNINSVKNDTIIGMSRLK